MAELQENIALKKIDAPSLTQTNYGKNIREQFENIDDNFTRLSNADFVAGRDGSDIKFAKYELYDGTNLTDLGKAFIEGIVGESIDWENDWDGVDFTADWYNTHPTFKSVTRLYTVDGHEMESTYKFFDYIKTNPDISIMYQLIDPEAPDELEDVDGVMMYTNRHLLCSPYVYLFLDERYAALRDFNPADATYKTITDNSCVLNLVFHNEQPVITRINQFPTLYYDENDGQFKWKLYGNETGILAAGPRGIGAQSAPVHFVMIALDEHNTDPSLVSNPTLASNATITHVCVFRENVMEWVAISDAHEDERPKFGDPVFAFASVPQDGTIDYVPQDLYFTRVTYVAGTNIRVATGESVCLKFQVENTMLETLLTAVQYGGMGTRCLFVPIVNNNNGHSDILTDTPVHAIYTNQDVDNYNVSIRPIPYSSIRETDENIGKGSRTTGAARFNLGIYYDKTSIYGYSSTGDEKEIVSVNTRYDASTAPKVSLYGEVEIGKIVKPGSTTTWHMPKLSVPEGDIYAKNIEATTLIGHSLEIAGGSGVKTSISYQGIKLYPNLSTTTASTYIDGSGTNTNKLNVSGNADVTGNVNVGATTYVKDDIWFRNQRGSGYKWHILGIENAPSTETELALQSHKVSVFKDTNDSNTSKNNSLLLVRGNISRTGVDVFHANFSWTDAENQLMGAAGASNIVGWLPSGSVGVVAHNKQLEQPAAEVYRTIYVDWNDIVDSEYHTYDGTTVSTTFNGDTRNPPMVSRPVMIVGRKGIVIYLASRSLAKEHQGSVSRHYDTKRYVKIYNVPAYANAWLFIKIKHLYNLGPIGSFEPYIDPEEVVFQITSKDIRNASGYDSWFTVEHNLGKMRIIGFRTNSGAQWNNQTSSIFKRNAGTWEAVVEGSYKILYNSMQWIDYSNWEYHQMHYTGAGPATENPGIHMWGNAKIWHHNGLEDYSEGTTDDYISPDAQTRYFVYRGSGTVFFDADRFLPGDICVVSLVNNGKMLNWVNNSKQGSRGHIYLCVMGPDVKLVPGSDSRYQRAFYGKDFGWPGSW